MDAPPQSLQEVNRILCLHNLCPLLLVPLAVAELLGALRTFARRGCGPFLVMTDEVVGGGGGGGCRDGGDGTAAA